MVRRKTARVVESDVAARAKWLWVAHPKWVLDENGEDDPGLLPGAVHDPGGWWTCHKETRKGDLIILWRTSPFSDARFVLEATTDAYYIGDEEHARKHAWDYGCDYVPRLLIEPALGIADIRADPYLEDWNALRGRFQRRAFRLEERHWSRLVTMIDDRAEGFATAAAQLDDDRPPRSILLEEELEEALSTDLSPLARHGLHLELLKDKDGTPIGRQMVCHGAGGRMDLVCRDTRSGGVTVLELKNTIVGRNTVGQIMQYMAWTRENLAKRKPVGAVVIGRGLDAAASMALRELNGRVTFISLEDLGFM